MRLSLATPTHNPKYLDRAARSIFRQTFTGEIEWVIVPNAGVTEEQIRSIVDHPPGMPKRSNISIKVVPTNMKGIGALKKFAFAQCTGEAVGEYDHDDELVPECLDCLAVAFGDVQTDFAYSDCAEVNPDGSPFVFSPAFGWESYPISYQGSKLLALKSWDPGPASFSRIWYAPNHIRAWRRSFYEQIGGHDNQLEVLDDHDIMVRSYLQGHVQRIPSCLYIYHRTGENTCYGEKNAKIQVETVQIYKRNILKLVERWCDISGFPRIDLCAGEWGAPGWTGVDKRSGTDLDVTPWPFETSSIGAFRAFDALEHLRDPIATMKEIYRCLRPGGWLISNTPSTDGRGAFQDPTHRSFWCETSWLYYSNKNQAQYIGTPVRFQAPYVETLFPSDWHRAKNISYVRADLISLKDGYRPPGAIEI